jgi:hypothetical protein
MNIRNTKVKVRKMVLKALLLKMKRCKANIFPLLLLFVIVKTYPLKTDVFDKDTHHYNDTAYYKIVTESILINHKTSIEN